MTRECRESATGHGSPDAAGICPWCGVRIARALPKPAPRALPTTRLTEEYRRQYDPDYGSKDGEV